MVGAPPPCPACEEPVPLGGGEKSGDYTLLRCAHCELVFSHPMKVPAGFYDHFQEPYGWKWEFDAFLSRFPGKGERLLDVGCGNGFFLKKAVEAGYRVTGIDSSEHAVREAVESGLTDVFSGDPSRFAARFSGRFDVVTCFHTLEHVDRPREFLALLSGFARRGGRVVIGVPNARRFQARLRREMADFPPHHLTRWTSKSLAALLKRQSLKAVEITPERIRVSDLETTGYLLWLVLNNLTQVGWSYRRRVESSISGSTPPAGGAGSDVAPTLVRFGAAVKNRVNGALRRILGRGVYLALKGREFEGPGLLAVAEKRAVRRDAGRTLGMSGGQDVHNGGESANLASRP